MALWRVNDLATALQHCMTACITPLISLSAKKLARGSVIDHRVPIRHIGTVGDIERQLNRRAQRLHDAKQCEHFVDRVPSGHSCDAAEIEPLDDVVAS
jgi:hypothetical protein